MAAPNNNVRSKLNRALCAWLIQQGAGGAADVLPAQSVQPRAFPVTTVRSTLAKASPPFSGSYRVQVQIEIKGGATSPDGETNPENARLEFDQRVAATHDALLLTDNNLDLSYTAAQISAAGNALAVAVDDTDAAKLLAANNADMADFTCQQWTDLGTGDGEADEAGCDWEEILLFEALVCGSAIA